MAGNRVATVKSQVRLSLPTIRTVARETIVRQDRSNLPIEID